MNSRQKMIAVDIDDVLALSVDKFIEWSDKNFGTNIKFDEYIEDWSKLWGISQAKTNKRVEKMYAQNVHDDFLHIEEAAAVLEKLKKNYHLVITTARRKDGQAQTRRWIEKHYTQIFKDIHFAGIWDEITENSPTATKAKLCKELGVDYLIDDQVKHCIAADSVGVKALLFGDYPWNRGVSLPSNIIRVANWQEVDEYFAKQK